MQVEDFLEQSAARFPEKTALVCDGERWRYLQIEQRANRLAWAEGCLAEEELRKGGLLDPAPIARAWRELQNGQRSVGAALWAVVMFQAWRARWDV